MPSFFRGHPTVRNIVFIIVFILVVGTLIASAGWYPIVIVSGSVIYKYAYDDARDLSYAYYSYLAQNNQTADDDEKLRALLRPAVLEGLIDAQLAKKEMLTKMSAGEVQNAVDEKVSAIWSDAGSRNALLTMTQSSEKNIKRFFLEQEAYSQILYESLGSDQEAFNEWLLRERKEAHVIVWPFYLRWTEDGVQFKD